VQGHGQLGIDLHVLLEVGLDHRLQRVVAVGQIDRGPDVLEDLAVVHAARAGRVLEELDDLGVEGGLGQGEQGVDPVVVRPAQVRLLLAVQGAALLLRQRGAAVEGAADVAVLVELEDVAVPLVDDQAAHHELMVVGQAGDRVRVAEAPDQLVDRQLEGQALHLLLHVGQQRVVHVEADESDLVEAEGAVHEHAAGVGEHHPVRVGEGALDALVVAGVSAVPVVERMHRPNTTPTAALLR
jgi:hypothetical protein